MIGLNEGVFCMQANDRMDVYLGDTDIYASDALRKPEVKKDTPLHQFLERRFRDLQLSMLSLTQHPDVKCVKETNDSGLFTERRLREIYRTEDGTDLMIVDTGMDMMTGEEFKSISYHVSNSEQHMDIWYQFDLDSHGEFMSGSRRLTTYFDKDHTRIKQQDVEINRSNGSDVYVRKEYDFEGILRREQS